MKDYKPKIKVSSLLRLQKFLSIYHVTSGKEEGACLRNLNLSWPPPRFALIQWKIARMKIFDIQIPMSGNLKCLMIIRMCRLLKKNLFFTSKKMWMDCGRNSVCRILYSKLDEWANILIGSWLAITPFFRKGNNHLTINHAQKCFSLKAFKWWYNINNKKVKHSISDEQPLKKCPKTGRLLSFQIGLRRSV